MNSSLQNTFEPLLRDTVMITQNVPLNNTQEGKIQKWNKWNRALFLTLNNKKHRCQCYLVMYHVTLD